MITLTILLAIVSAVKCADMLGPVDVLVQRVEKCGEDTLGASMDHQWHRINRTMFAIDIEWNLPFPMDEKVGINITGFKWGDGGWKPGAFDQYREDACGTMLHFYPSFKAYLESWDQPETCPLQAGHYVTKNHLIDLDIKYPLMYGEFKVEIRFDFEKSVFTCVRAFIKNTPKQKTIG